MTVQEFFDKYDDKHLDFDGVYGTQCKDVISAYNAEVVGAPRFYGNAIDAWTNYPTDFYDKIPNDDINDIPQKGDIVIWGTKLGQYGHIAIAKGWGDTKQFDSFDQNYPVTTKFDANGKVISLGSPCHFQRHSYSGVLGWLRPKKNVNENPVPPVVTPPPVTDNHEAVIADLTSKLNTANIQVAELLKNQITAEHNKAIADKAIEEYKKANPIPEPVVCRDDSVIIAEYLENEKKKKKEQFDKIVNAIKFWLTGKR